MEYHGQNAVLPLLVVQEDGPSLIGRNWLAQIRLDWNNIFSINNRQSLEDLLNQHSSVFQDELGTVRDVKVKLYVKENCTPTFFKPRTLPLALREKVSNELDQLEASGIIVPVKLSPWASPVVPVIKKDGSVRLCGDYKVTVNNGLKSSLLLCQVERFFPSWTCPIHIFNYNWMKHHTINTHRGLYRYTRLPFGVASARAIFQCTMETLLRGLPMVVVYIDDILVAGRSQEEHLTNLTQVLRRLDDAGMRLKKEKCSFCLSEVEYLGHSISAEGLRPSMSKVKAITDAPNPPEFPNLNHF